jgi:hypothetical protein
VELANYEALSEETHVERKARSQESPIWEKEESSFQWQYASKRLVLSLKETRLLSVQTEQQNLVQATT